MTLLLSFTVSDLSALGRLRSAWEGLACHNPALTNDLVAVLLLTPEPEVVGCATHMVFAGAEGNSVQIRCLTMPPGRTLGERLNTAMVWALASPASYWLHWSLDYICLRPFWDGAKRTLETSCDGIWQLQLTDDWLDVGPERLLRRDGHTVVLPAVAQDGEDEEMCWPLFSLRPGVLLLPLLRAAHSNRMLPWFDSEADSAEAQEMHFGHQIQRLNFVKAVLEPAAAAPRVLY